MDGRGRGEEKARKCRTESRKRARGSGGVVRGSEGKRSENRGDR